MNDKKYLMRNPHLVTSKLYQLISSGAGTS